MIVSIQGYQGSFHHIVATQIWGNDVQLKERSSFSEVFADVLNETVPVGIVAVENTITGSIAETLDLLSAKPVTIIGEYVLPIHQNLIVLPGTTISDLKTVYSHPVAIKQCLDFFKSYPDINLRNSDDTGRSVQQMMANGDRTVGSIASSLAAQIHQAEILAENIESNHHNYTRFLILTRTGANPTLILKNTLLAPEVAKNSLEQKVALILHLKHEPGQLARCLSVIADHGGNLMRIESRPILGKPWEYTIHVDVLIKEDSALQAILNKLNDLTEKSDIKGIFPPAHSQLDLVS